MLNIFFYPFQNADWSPPRVLAASPQAAAAAAAAAPAAAAAKASILDRRSYGAAKAAVAAIRRGRRSQAPPPALSGTPGRRSRLSVVPSNSALQESAAVAETSVLLDPALTAEEKALQRYTRMHST